MRVHWLPRESGSSGVSEDSRRMFNVFNVPYLVKICRIFGDLCFIPVTLLANVYNVLYS